MPKKRKKTSISEIKQLDKRKSRSTKSNLYYKTIKFWDYQRDILKRLIDEYKEEREKWIADLDEFTELWTSCVRAELKVTEKLNSKDFIEDLPIFIKAKQSVDKLLDKKNYSSHQQSLLKNSYVIVYLLSLEDWFMEEQGFLKARDFSVEEKTLIPRNYHSKKSFSDLNMWLINYYVFHQDCLFEFPQLEWFLEQVSNTFK